MLEYIQYMDKSILFNYIEELYSRNTIVDDTTNEIISIYNTRPDLGKMKETYVQYKRRKFLIKNPVYLDYFKNKIPNTEYERIIKYLNNKKVLCRNTKCIKKTYITPKDIYKNIDWNEYKFCCHKHGIISCYKDLKQQATLIDH
jgi:hypothetical protein